MSETVDPSEIEGIVGAPRHPKYHIVRAVSAEQRVYILHPDECTARMMHRPLTECAFSRTLAYEGIDEEAWKNAMDRPVVGILTFSGLRPNEYWTNVIGLSNG